jgi:hypothetical protein
MLAALFNVLFLLIEPGFPEVMADSQLNTSLYWASKFGAPEDALDKMKDEFNREDITSRYGIGGTFIGIGIGIVLWAIGAAIAALFVKKSPPEVL